MNKTKPRKYGKHKEDKIINKHFWKTQTLKLIDKTYALE